MMVGGDPVLKGNTGWYCAEVNEMATTAFGDGCFGLLSAGKTDVFGIRQSLLSFDQSSLTCRAIRQLNIYLMGINNGTCKYYSRESRHAYISEVAEVLSKKDQGISWLVFIGSSK